MSTASDPKLQSIKAEMEKTNALLNTEVVGKRNFAALDEIYTANARILPPGAPMISGRDAIKEFWSHTVAQINATSVILESVEVVLAGDGMVEIGRGKLMAGPEAQQSEMEIKYVVHWKQEDGRWKWDIDIWNVNS